MTTFARFILRHDRFVLVVAIVLVVIGVALGARLKLQTDLSELLPPGADSVTELKAISKRVGGTGAVSIALEGEPQALRIFIPRAVDALRRELGTDIVSLKYQRKEVDDYFKRFAAYYVPLEDLKRWTRLLHQVVEDETAHVNPAFVDITDDEPHAKAKKLVADLRAAQKSIGPKNTADPETGLLMSEEGHLGVIFLRPATNSFNLAASGHLVARLRSIIEGAGAAQAGVRIAGFTGSIPFALAEIESIRRDIFGTALLVIILVGGVVCLYFRSVREVLLLSLALLVGAAVAFAFAYLWIGHVNAQTAFLGSIIVGTGINYGVILLARYNDLRRDGSAFEEALVEAMRTTVRATSIAAAATAVSFGVLAAGTVESFHQFGWIGGIGVLACWLATFTVVPATLSLFDRNRVYAPRPRTQPLVRLMREMAGPIMRRSRLVFAVCGVLVVLSLAAAYHRRNDALQSNYGKLGTQSASLTSMHKLDLRLRKMDTGSSTPAVIPTANPAQAEEACQVLRKISADSDGRFMRRCFSVQSMLPDQLDARGKLLALLQHDLEKVQDDAVDAADRSQLADLRRAIAERPPVPKDLPLTLVEPFTERDGSIGKLAFVEPHHEEVQENLYAFADSIRTIRLPSGAVIHASGETVVLADVLRAVARDARRLTGAAAVLVLVVLALFTRKLRPFLRVGLALFVGVVWMVGLAAAFGEKLNFFNFVALPTTFGIGVDYAINVEERLRLRIGRVADALAEVGPPVLLASSTTVLGYATLLIADNQALKSFAQLAILGEVTCVIAALVLAPALWVRSDRAGAATSADR